MDDIHIIQPRSGAGFRLAKGQTLTVIDPHGEQVGDLLCFNADDTDEALSNGRTIDYASKIYFTTGDKLYSNRSNVMLTIGEDTVGKHDFLLTPCSAEMFRILYDHEKPHRGCFGNLAAAVEPFGVKPDQIPVAFNVFMNVPVDGETGSLSVEPPRSKPGDFTRFTAEMDLIVGLTSCSAPLSNNGSFKPIHYSISDGAGS
jgi:uncharacterized protein YcgI (DUF1989 family)